MQACLTQAKAAIGSDPGFDVLDMHRNDGRVSFAHGGTLYTGIIDVGVVPFGVRGDTCRSQLRIGLELKQTAQQKQRYRNNNPAGDFCSPHRCYDSSCCSQNCADVMLLWVLRSREDLSLVKARLARHRCQVLGP